MEPEKATVNFGDNFIFSFPISLKFENLDNILITFILTFKIKRVQPVLPKGRHFCPRKAFR